MKSNYKMSFVFILLGVLLSLSAQAQNYCSIINPGQRDASGRYCNGTYGVILGGYILDNSCYNDINNAYQSMQTNGACAYLQPVVKGDCRVFNPGERDANGAYCDNTYGLAYRGVIVNNTCYTQMMSAISLLQQAQYCGFQPPPPPPPPPPQQVTVNLTVNGTQHIAARAGTTVFYAWSSQGVVSVDSFYYTTNRGDVCPGGYTQDDFNNHRTKPWVQINPDQQQQLSAQVQACQAGVSYTIVIVGHGSNGQSATSQIIVDVPN